MIKKLLNKKPENSIVVHFLFMFFFVVWIVKVIEHSIEIYKLGLNSQISSLHLIWMGISGIVALVLFNRLYCNKGKEKNGQ